VIASLALRLLQKTHLQLDRATKLVVAIERLADELNWLSERHGPPADRDKSKLFRHGKLKMRIRNETASNMASSSYSCITQV